MGLMVRGFPGPGSSTKKKALLGEWRWQDAPNLAPGGYGLQASIFDAGIRVNY